MSSQVDLCGFVTTTTGTGSTITVDGSVTESGLRTLAQAITHGDIAVGAVVSYCIVTGTGSGTQRETGTATVGTGGLTLEGRTLVSSTTDALLSLTGTSTVMLGPNKTDFNAIGPVAVTGTPTVGQVPIASSGTAAAWGTPSGGGLPTGVTSPGDGALNFATGTITASRPSINITQTWNNAAVTFEADVVNITNTASASGSTLLSRKIGGVNKFVVDKTGSITLADASSTISCAAGAAGIGGAYSFTSGSAFAFRADSAGSAIVGTGIQARSAFIIGWSSTSNWYDTRDSGLGRSAAGTLEINNGITAGTFRDLKLRNLTSIGGVITPSQYTTATRPAWVNGAVIFDTDLDKLVIGGASAWEAVTSA